MKQKTFTVSIWFGGSPKPDYVLENIVQIDLSKADRFLVIRSKDGVVSSFSTKEMFKFITTDSDENGNTITVPKGKVP